MNKQLPTNRRFGSLFTIVFIGLSIYFFNHDGSRLIIALNLTIAAFFGLATAFNSKILTPINRLWFLLGQAMGKVISPLMLGIIFFVLITPIAVVAKLLGRDELRLKRPKTLTYWVSPVGSSSDPDSFKNQF